MITVLGMVAAALTTGCWLPQILRTLRTRSARDFSWVYLVVLIAGVVCWAIYGVLRKDLVIIVANSATVLVLMGILVIKLRTELRPVTPPQPRVDIG